MGDAVPGACRLLSRREFTSWVSCAEDIAVGAQMIPLIAIGAPVCFAFVLSIISLIEERTAWSFVQLLGAACLMIVVFAHVAEAFSLFPWMGWGLPDSAGHYVDLVSAVAGLILFPIGHLARSLARRTERHCMRNTTAPTAPAAG